MFPQLPPSAIGSVSKSFSLLQPLIVDDDVLRATLGNSIIPVRGAPRDTIVEIAFEVLVLETQSGSQVQVSKPCIIFGCVEEGRHGVSVVGDPIAELRYATINQHGFAVDGGEIEIESD